MSATETAMCDLADYVRGLGNVAQVEEDDREIDHEGTVRVFEVELEPGVEAAAFEQALRADLFEEFIERRDYDVESFVFNTSVTTPSTLVLIAVGS